MAQHLLPSSRTDLETALSVVIGPRLLDEPLPIAGFKSEPADGLLPWLIWEYGLEELRPFIVDPRRLLTEGIRFQRIRGTPASLLMALGWVGAPDAAIEEHPGDPHLWAKIQLDPGLVPSRAVAQAIVSVARLALPARAHLVRLYHGYDIRAIRTDRGQLDRDLLDDWSGVDLDGVRQSYGTVRHAVVAMPAPVPHAGAEVWTGAAFHRDRAARLDIWRLDTAWEPLLVAAASMAVEAHHLDRPRPPVPVPAAWRMPVAVAADGVMLDGINCVLDGAAVIQEAVPGFTLDGGLRLDAPPAWRWIALNALSVGAVAYEAAAAAPVLVAYARTEAVGLHLLAAPVILSPAAMDEARGVAFAPKGRPWGAGPWLDASWDETAGGYTMEEHL